MTFASTASITPSATALEAVPPAQTPHIRGASACPASGTSAAARTAFQRATSDNYPDWLAHVRAAAGCTRPIRLAGTLLSVDSGTGQLLDTATTGQLPDGVIYKPCGNRRATVCPTCSVTYQNDAYQLLHAGLAGGKGVPETVAQHPAVFATFTAPSFGTVHNRIVRHHTCHSRRWCDCRPQPCHARRAEDPTSGLCRHGRAAVCFARHQPDDPRLGEPLCLDCYDHDSHVVWNLFAGELWRRTKQAIERHLGHTARQRGLSLIIWLPDGKYRSASPIRVSHGKVAEFQTRGAIHFHALLRLDGIDPTNPDAIIPPPAGITVEDIDDAIRTVVAEIVYTAPDHPTVGTGWEIGWGREVDVQPIVARCGELSDRAVAGYLAKYTTKSTEATGHTSTRITRDNYTAFTADGRHIARLIAACWRLGSNPTPLVVDYDTNPYLRLRRWAHMLGFGGHFLTKAPRYSVTFSQLRGARAVYRRDQDTRNGTLSSVRHQHDDRVDDVDTILIVGNLTYTGTGWHTLGDALLANTAAAQARQYAITAREELAQLQTFASAELVAA